MFLVLKNICHFNGKFLFNNIFYFEGLGHGFSDTFFITCQKFGARIIALMPLKEIKGGILLEFQIADFCMDLCSAVIDLCDQS